MLIKKQSCNISSASSAATALLLDTNQREISWIKRGRERERDRERGRETFFLQLAADINYRYTEIIRSCATRTTNTAVKRGNREMK